MLYTRPSFSCPAASVHTSQFKWDLAMLTPAQFMAIYYLTPWEYERVRNGQ